MASSTTNAGATNLATLLAVKRKMGGNKPAESNGTQPAMGAGAHSKDKILYRSDLQIAQPTPSTTTTTPNQTKPTPTDKTEPSKIGRKTKQLEVGLLDKKMEEIQRKQDQKTNEAIDSWKGFEDMNYGFYSNGMPSRAPPAPAKKPEEPPIKREPSPKKPVEEPPIKREPSPKKPVEEPLKPVPKAEEPLKPKQKVREPPPSPPIEEEEPKPTANPPTPPPRRSRANSHQPLSREKTLEREPVPVPYESIITPIPLMRSNPKPVNKEPMTFLGSTWNPVSTNSFRIFPDIKPYRMAPSQNAAKSIQRSMDRYRFYVW